MSDVRDLLRAEGFRRLLAVRLSTQFADGVFQGALAILFFFSPEQARTPEGIAAAFAVLTLPFTLIGPWAGVPLDRWSRRNALVLGSVARSGLALLAVALLAAEHSGLALYVVALAVVSINRFMLSAMSSGLPHVVHPRTLVTANAVTPTAGTAAFTVGAGAAYAATAADVPASAVVAGAAVVLAITAVLGLRLGPEQLGPDVEEQSAARRAQPLRQLTQDMITGLRHLRRKPTALAALSAMGAHRFFYGAATLSTVLIVRSRFGAEDAGLAVSGQVVAALGVGLLLSAVTTPAWVRHTRPTLVGGAALVGMAAGLFALSTRVTVLLLVLAAAMFGWGGQTLKICVDTILQRDVEDGYRGRVFSVYDVLFNAAFLLAMVICAPLMPHDGYSAGLFAVLAVGYVAAAVLYLGSRRTQRRRLDSPG